MKTCFSKHFFSITNSFRYGWQKAGSSWIGEQSVCWSNHRWSSSTRSSLSSMFHCCYSVSDFCLLLHQSFSPVILLFLFFSFLFETLSLYSALCRKRVLKMGYSKIYFSITSNFRRYTDLKNPFLIFLIVFPFFLIMSCTVCFRQNWIFHLFEHCYINSMSWLLTCSVSIGHTVECYWFVFSNDNFFYLHFFTSVTKTMPMQIDGEPWMQAPSEVSFNEL